MTRADLAVIKEREGARTGKYPSEWPEVARLIKQRADWKCERCSHSNDYQHGFTLTVHHLDGNKWNLEWWNLAALCQRCHLRVQARVDWWQMLLYGEHSQWLVDHIEGYNIWATLHHLPEHRIEAIRVRSYASEWSEDGSAKP